MNWRGAVLLAICVSLMPACGPGRDAQDADATLAADDASGVTEEATDAESITTLESTGADEGYKLVARLSGVWAGSDRSGGAPATLFVLGHSIDHEMDVSRNGVGLDLRNVDVDAERGVATYAFRGSKVNERLTFQRVDVDGPGDASPLLRVTYANGTHEDLSFVRPLNQQDIEQLDIALYERPLLKSALAHRISGLPSLRVNCPDSKDFRSRAVCTTPALQTLDQALAQRFEDLDMTDADVSGTHAAALKQLDACSDSRCLARVYKSWKAYLDNNFAAKSSVTVE